jgi:hypothetical protein
LTSPAVWGIAGEKKRVIFWLVGRRNGQQKNRPDFVAKKGLYKEKDVEI